MNETWIYVSSYYPHHSDPVVTGRGIGEIWLKSRDRYIDFWGCDFYGRGCLDAFLDVLDGAGLVREAANIMFHFHVCPGPADELNYYDYTRLWVRDYLKNVTMRERLLGV